MMPILLAAHTPLALCASIPLSPTTHAQDLQNIIDGLPQGTSPAEVLNVIGGENIQAPPAHAG